MDSHNCFNFTLILHKVTFHVELQHIFGVAHLLAMTKPSTGVCRNVVWEMLYQFTSHILCLQFCNVFATHFSPHQFGVTTKGECETTIHDIKCILDLHLDWVVFQLSVANAFNLVSKWVIFQEFHATSGDII
jgi:hypothetical protein